MRRTFGHVTPGIVGERKLCNPTRERVDRFAPGKRGQHTGSSKGGVTQKKKKKKKSTAGR